VPLPLGAVTNRRSLVSVWNLSSLIQQALEHPAAPGRAWLVSDGEDVSTADLVRFMAKAAGKSPRLVPVPVWMLAQLGRLSGRRDDVLRLTESLQVDISDTRPNWHGTAQSRWTRASGGRSRRTWGRGMSSVWPALLVAGSLGLAAVLTGAVRRHALRAGVMDVPNARSRTRSPRLAAAGLAIVPHCGRGCLVPLVVRRVVAGIVDPRTGRPPVDWWPRSATSMTGRD